MLQLSDKSLRHRLLVAAAIGVLLPPAFGGVLMSVAGFYPLPDLPLLTYICVAAVVLVAGVLAVWVAWTVADKLAAVARLAPGEAAARLYSMLRPAPVYLLAALSLYSVVGVAVAEASLIASGTHESFDIAQRRSHLVAALLPVLAAAMPLFFFFNSALDGYFAPRRIVVVATSLHVKLLVSSLVVPLLVDVMLLSYFTNRDGALDRTALWIWAGLLGVTVSGFLIARRDLRRILEPLQYLIESPRDLTSGRDVLVPRSLDEFGVITSKLQSRLSEEDELRRDVNVLADRLLQATNATGLGIFDHDQLSESLYWSVEQRRIFGVGPDEEITPAMLMDFVHPEDKARFVAALGRSLAGENDGKFSLEHRIVRRDGSVRWIAGSAQTTFAQVSGCSVPARTVGVVMDITGRVQKENAQRELEAELQQSRRLQAIGTFASGIAHDFNNLLSVIGANLEVLKSLMPVGHEASVHLKLIGMANDRGASLVQQISEFARGQRQTLVPTRVWSEVEESVVLARAEAHSGVVISMSGKSVDVRVMSGTGQLQRVVTNLLRNAVQAIGGRDGDIRIDVAEVPSADLAEAIGGTRRSGTWARIRIIDSGPGMSADVVERIFEPFFTTRVAGSGTGLGLAIVDSIVRSLGGRINVRSEPGTGTTFEVLIPAVMSEAASSVEDVR